MTNKNKILIVDDDPIGRQLLEAVFLEEDYELEFAGNGKEALSTVLNKTPDLILLDVMMPEMDGFEVCQNVRTNELFKGIPIILITALDDRDSRKRGLEAGANDYISKPFDRNEIVTKVKNLLQLNLSGNIPVKSAPDKSLQTSADEMSYYVNLLTESQKPLKSYMLRYIQDYFYISYDTNESDSCFFWFAADENKLYLMFIESTITRVHDKVLNLLTASFLNRTIQAKQFQTAADLISQLNNFLSEKISLSNQITSKDIKMSLSLVIIDKIIGTIQSSGFNQSIFIQNDVSLSKTDLDQTEKFPNLGIRFKNHSFSLSGQTNIYFVNSHTLGCLEKNGYFRDDNLVLKKYFSGLKPQTMKEQETSFRQLFENANNDFQGTENIELIGIRI